MYPIAIDLGARKIHEDQRWPGVKVCIRALPSTLSLFCRDHAKEWTDAGLQFNDNSYLSWLFRFGVESIEGMKIEVRPEDLEKLKDKKLPPFLEEYSMADTSYPIVSTFWFDRVHPLAIRAFAEEVDKFNNLSGDVKKKSERPPGSDDAADGTSSGTAAGAPKKTGGLMATIKRALPRST